VTLHPQGNQMKFKETEFSVPADTEITLTFENTASSPSMQHNVVLLNEAPSQSVFQRVGQAGVKAGASAEYVPDDPAVLAATDISKPGETVTVTFTSPAETGDYGYVCTYPGHWAMMQGTMHVV
jgi:azurin